MKKTFDIKNLFTDAWSDYKSHWKLFILIGIIFGLVGLLGNMGMTIDPTTGAVSQSPIVSIAAWALQMFITLGYIKFVLNIVDKKEVKIEQLFQGADTLKHFISFLVVSLLVSTLTTLGYFLLIVPGVMLTVGLLFSQYLAAEEKTGIFESLKESWKGTRKTQWKILWFMIVAIFFNLFGALALLIGLAITIPMTSLMYARMYRQLFDCECTDDECACETEASSLEESEEIVVEEILEGDQSQSDK